jgi:hypothetical protein
VTYVVGAGRVSLAEPRKFRAHDARSAAARNAADVDLPPSLKYWRFELLADLELGDRLGRRRDAEGARRLADLEMAQFGRSAASRASAEAEDQRESTRPCPSQAEHAQGPTRIAVTRATLPNHR